MKRRRLCKQRTESQLELPRTDLALEQGTGVLIMEWDSELHAETPNNGPESLRTGVGSQ